VNPETALEESKEPKVFKFPTIEQMSKATEQQLRQLGFGYRAGFIVASVKMIQEKGGQKWLDDLRGQPLDKVRSELIQLKGVGNKVADCIALFSLDCDGCVPVDTHVFQIA